MSTKSDAKRHIMFFMEKNPGVALTHYDMGTVLRLSPFYAGGLTPSQRKDDTNGGEVWEKSYRDVFCHSSDKAKRELEGDNIFPTGNNAWVMVIAGRVKVIPYATLVKSMIKSIDNLIPVASGDLLKEISHMKKVLVERYK